VWVALCHRGSSNLADQQALIRAAVALLPSDVPQGVHGDSEFRSQELFGWLRMQGYAAMLGVDGRLWVYESPDPTAVGQPLATRVTPLPPQTQTGRKRQHRTSLPPLFSCTTTVSASGCQLHQPGHPESGPGGLSRWDGLSSCCRPLGARFLGQAL